MKELELISNVVLMDVVYEIVLNGLFFEVKFVVGFVGDDEFRGM